MLSNAGMCRPGCLALLKALKACLEVYWAQGFDISTGTNCKLMNASS